jgi:hypothetical protein
MDAVVAREKPDARRAGAGWLGVACAVLVFAAAVTAENRARYLSLRSTFAPDLGCFDNQAFNVSQGRDVTYLSMAAWFPGGDFDGPSVYRSAHFTPLRTLLVPQLYRLWPRVETLMFLQGLFVGVGALGLYGFALDRTGRPALGLALAGSYLLHPALLATASNDVREITFGIGPALVALWLHAAGRFRLAALAALLALAARSEFALLVAAFGIVNFRLLPPAARRTGLLLPVVLAAAWGALAETYYRYYYGTHWPLLAFASGAGGEPLASIVATWLSRLPQFFALLLLPAVGALATPEAFALAMPFVALAKRVHATQFPPHHLQHLSPAVVAIFWGFAASLVALARRRSVSGALVIAGLWAAALACAAFYAVAAWSAYPRDLEPFARFERWDERLPADATILVPGSLAARFSGHTRVLNYDRLPMPKEATPAEVDAALGTIIAAADLAVVFDDVPEIAARVAGSGLFEKPRVFRRYTVFARRPDAPRVDRPDARIQAALLWDRFSARQRRGATLAATK